MDRLYSCLILLLVAPSCHPAVGQEQGSGVSVKWGVADGTATVGRLFRMHIPSDAFSGDVVSLQVQTVDGGALPSWLQFDDGNNILQGIPAPKDAGQLFLMITAKGRGSQASVTFTVFVRDVASHTIGAPLRFKSSGPEFVHCKPSEAETVATVVVDVDVESLPVTERVSLLQKFVSHMQLHEDMVKLIPVGSAPMHDNSALVSGTGDAMSPKTTGSFISWPVGCGQVKDGHFPVLQRLDEDSSSGKFAHVLGYPIIGWYVTNSHLLAPTRKRRQVHATPTPVVTPILPTKTLKPGDKTDEPTDMMTHAVIDKETPTVIQPTATQPDMPKSAMPTPIDTKPPKPVKPLKVTTTTTETPVKVPGKDKPVDIKPTITAPDGQPTDVTKPVACVPGKTLMSHLNTISMTDGAVYTHVFENLFNDKCQNYSARDLELTLLKDTNTKISPHDFVQFDPKKHKLTAFPVNNAGNHNFTLVAKKGEAMGLSTFLVEVKHRKGTFSQKLSAVVDYDYDELMKNTTDKIEIAHHIGRIFNKEMKSFHFHEISKGSVNYTWSFVIPRNCKPVDIKEITELVDQLITEDNKLTETAVNKMKPYKLIGAEAVPAGACLSNPKFPSRSVKPEKDVDKVTVDKKTDEATTMPEHDEDDSDIDDTETTTTKPTTTPSDVTKMDVAKGSKGGDDDDVWITTVVPAVVIIVILLIALLVACCLYRKKRKGKMNVEDRHTFVNKGAPVIFPEELEDKPSDVNKPLLIEGNPAPPPEYHRGPSESPERNLPGNFRNNGNNKALLHDEGINEMPERPYNPPAPPVGGSASNKQPRHAQQSFSQPPQILP